MECFNQANEIESHEINFNNENIIYQNFTKQTNWFFIVKSYIMNSKWGSLYNGLSSYLTKIGQKIILISILIFMMALASHCRENLFHQYFKNCRLFPQHSIIKDYIYGESDLLHNDLINSDLSFVVYYAPWDHDSNQFKSIFYKTAVHFHEQITFASINCWYPEGKCKKSEELMKYPVVILHARLPSNKRAISIQYTGPLLLSHVHRFLNRALQPFAYIANMDELDQLELLYQIVILGCFNNKVPSTLDFFYYASLITLQFPYMSDITFAATYNVSLCGGRSTIKLISWNKTVNYPTGALYQTKDIIHFIQKNIVVIPRWVPVHEYRSDTLSILAANGPVMVVFIPDDPTNLVNDAYLILRSVVLDYMNCKNDSKIYKQIVKLGHLPEEQLSSIIELCLNYSEGSEQDTSAANDFIYTDSWCEHAIRNNTNQCNMYGSSHYCLLDEELWFGKSGYAESSLLRNIEYYYKNSVFTANNNTTFNTNSCKEYLPLPPMGPIEDENVQLAKKWFMGVQCKNKPFSNSTVKQIKSNIPSMNISGLKCSSNKTLNFVAINSIQRNDLISNGIISSSNVWIVDSNSEELYHLKDTLSRDNLVNFIYNYTNGLLNRKHIVTNLVKYDAPNKSLSILELHAENYLNVTQENGRAFIVLHYASYCGACKSIASVFFACNKLLEGISDVTFARIDVSKNSLPWHLTFTQVPQIIFYPSEKKADSEVLDISLEINTRSLLLFLLSKLNSKSRLKFACDQKGMQC